MMTWGGILALVRAGQDGRICRCRAGGQAVSQMGVRLSCRVGLTTCASCSFT